MYISPWSGGRRGRRKVSLTVLAFIFTWKVNQRWKSYKMHINFQWKKCLDYLTTSAFSIARMNLHVIPLENVQPISFYFLSCFFIFLLYKAQHCSPGAGLQVVDCKRWDWVCHRSLEARIFSAENIFKSLFQFRGSNTSCSQRIFVSLHILYITLVVIFKKTKSSFYLILKWFLKNQKAPFIICLKIPKTFYIYLWKLKSTLYFIFENYETQLTV